MENFMNLGMLKINYSEMGHRSSLESLADPLFLAT